MPLYEYSCAACSASEERLCGYEAPAEYDCPSCGAAGGMRRQLSVPAIAFAGGGWYAEGYSHAKPETETKAKAKTDKPCEGGPKGAGGGACENCPANK
jgi:putative FmdB family regulatory protein